jgi:hypothetical protein
LCTTGCGFSQLFEFPENCSGWVCSPASREPATGCGFLGKLAEACWARVQEREKGRDEAGDGLFCAARLRLVKERHAGIRSGNLDAAPDRTFVKAALVPVKLCDSVIEASCEPPIGEETDVERCSWRGVHAATIQTNVSTMYAQQPRGQHGISSHSFLGRISVAIAQAARPTLDPDRLPLMVLQRAFEPAT